jgi:ABC-type molybdate transport system substrate-binding protein
MTSKANDYLANQDKDENNIRMEYSGSGCVAKQIK